MTVPLQEPLEMLDHRIKCTVGVIRGTTQRQPERALICHMLGEYTHQARFAKASLTAEQDRLAQSVATLRPAFSQQPHLMLPANSVRLNFCMEVELSDASGQYEPSIQL